MRCSIAGSATAVGALVAGLIMDYLGTRAARLFSSVFVVAGSLMLAYAGPESLMWFPGLACLGFGGNGVQVGRTGPLPLRGGRRAGFDGILATPPPGPDLIRMGRQITSFHISNLFAGNERLVVLFLATRSPSLLLSLRGSARAAAAAAGCRVCARVPGRGVHHVPRITSDT